MSDQPHFIIFSVFIHITLNPVTIHLNDFGTLLDKKKDQKTIRKEISLYLKPLNIWIFTAL